MRPGANGSAEVLLEVQGLHKTYRARRRGAKEVVANVGISLKVHAGEVVAVLGPNGAGKSTFLKQVGGQLLPTKGSIRVCGVDIVAEPERAKHVLSVIPQECTPYASLTVEEHVRLFAVIKGMETARAREETASILDRVGLTEHRNKLIRELSGGLKRRVLIGVALAGPSVRLLLLDEPTTGLDPEARREVWKVIAGLRDQGRGVLLTTHYIEEAEVLADRVVVIAEGKVLAEGTPDEIQARAGSRGRLDIFNFDRLPPAARTFVEQLKARWPPTQEREDRLRLSVPDPFAASTIAELARLTDLGVRASLSPASLEDAYPAITGVESTE